MICKLLKWLKDEPKYSPLGEVPVAPEAPTPKKRKLTLTWKSESYSYNGTIHLRYLSGITEEIPLVDHYDHWIGGDEKATASRLAEAIMHRHAIETGNKIIRLQDVQSIEIKDFTVNTHTYENTKTLYHIEGSNVLVCNLVPCSYENKDCFIDRLYEKYPRPKYTHQWTDLNDL